MGRTESFRVALLVHGRRLSSASGGHSRWLDPRLDLGAASLETRAVSSQDLSRRTPWLLLAVGLALAMFALFSLIDASLASAACLERAKYELILCVAPPEAWQFVLNIGSGLLVAVLAVQRGLASRR